MEGIGYVGRIQSHFDRWVLGPYLQQTLMLLVAPALYAASIYMVLGRLIIVLNGEHLSLIRIRWLTKIFVGGDVLSFLMQSGGGGLMSSKKPDMMKMGENLVVGGLFVQIIFFSIFVAVSVVFNIRIQERPTPMSEQMTRSGRKGWLTLLRVLYAASALILIRSIFRVIEYLQGNGGYLLRSEVWLYVFDSVLMLGVPVLLNVVHPSGVVPGKLDVASRLGGSIDSRGTSRSEDNIKLMNMRGVAVRG